jgi:transposase-like protein
MTKPNTANLHEWASASSEPQRVKDLEREVKELPRANVILKLASVFFAQGGVHP